MSQSISEFSKTVSSTVIKPVERLTSLTGLLLAAACGPTVSEAQVESPARAAGDTPSQTPPESSVLASEQDAARAIAEYRRSLEQLQLQCAIVLDTVPGTKGEIGRWNLSMFMKADAEAQKLFDEKQYHLIAPLLSDSAVLIQTYWKQAERYLADRNELQELRFKLEKLHQQSNRFGLDAERLIATEQLRKASDLWSDGQKEYVDHLDTARGLVGVLAEKVTLAEQRANDRRRNAFTVQVVSGIGAVLALGGLGVSFVRGRHLKAEACKQADKLLSSYCSRLRAIEPRLARAEVHSESEVKGFLSGINLPKTASGRLAHELIERMHGSRALLDVLSPLFAEARAQYDKRTRAGYEAVLSTLTRSPLTLSDEHRRRLIEYGMIKASPFGGDVVVGGASLSGSALLSSLETVMGGIEKRLNLFVIAATQGKTSLASLEVAIDRVSDSIDSLRRSSSFLKDILEPLARLHISRLRVGIADAQRDFASDPIRGMEQLEAHAAVASKLSAYLGTITNTAQLHLRNIEDSAIAIAQKGFNAGWVNRRLEELAKGEIRLLGSAVLTQPESKLIERLRSLDQDARCAEEVGGEVRVARIALDRIVSRLAHAESAAVGMLNPANGKLNYVRGNSLRDPHYLIGSITEDLEPVEQFLTQGSPKRARELLKLVTANHGEVEKAIDALSAIAGAYSEKTRGWRFQIANVEGMRDIHSEILSKLKSHYAESCFDLFSDGSAREKIGTVLNNIEEVQDAVSRLKELEGGLVDVAQEGHVYILEEMYEEFDEKIELVKILCREIIDLQTCLNSRVAENGELLAVLGSRVADLGRIAKVFSTCAGTRLSIEGFICAVDLARGACSQVPSDPFQDARELRQLVLRAGQLKNQIAKDERDYEEAKRSLLDSQQLLEMLRTQVEMDLKRKPGEGGDIANLRTTLAARAMRLASYASQLERAQSDWLALDREISFFSLEIGTLLGKAKPSDANGAHISKLLADVGELFAVAQRWQGATSGAVLDCGDIRQVYRDTRIAFYNGGDSETTKLALQNVLVEINARLRRADWQDSDDRKIEELAARNAERRSRPRHSSRKSETSSPTTLR